VLRGKEDDALCDIRRSDRKQIKRIACCHVDSIMSRETLPKVEEMWLLDGNNMVGRCGSVYRLVDRFEEIDVERYRYSPWKDGILVTYLESGVLSIRGYELNTCEEELIESGNYVVGRVAEGYYS